MDPIEDIRSRLPIEEVVSQYVSLKKAGRNFKGLCPFHQEKTPSFIVSPDKGLAYCFGCRKGGDIFAFIQEVEQLDFPSALRMLAEKAGVEIHYENLQSASKEEKGRQLTLLEEAHRFFKDRLQESLEALNSLEERGYKKALAMKLGFGFAPDSFHELTNFLIKKGFSEKELLDSGLAAQKEVGDSNVYDRFRNRIMFPIQNEQGKLVAFGGRTLSKDPEAAKYLNSPETKLYHKGRMLYLFHLAKGNIREKNQALIVEGYFDALTAHQYGLTETVASLGTALTEDQIKLLGRFTEHFIFAFDADDSGQLAASRSIELAQRLGYSVSILLIPSGKDPDEALRNDVSSFKEALQNAIPAIDYEFQKAFKALNSQTIEGKKQIVASLVPIIQRLPSQIEQEHHLKRLSFELEVSFDRLVADWHRLQKPTFHLHQPSEPALPSLSYSRADYLLGLLLNFPHFKNDLTDHFKLDYLENEGQKELYKITLNSYNHSDENMPSLKLLELYTEDRYSSFTEEQIKAEMINLCQAIRQDYKKRRLKSLRFQLAKHLTTEQEGQELMKEYQSLLAEQF